MFPLVLFLGSTGSAPSRPGLFVGFNAVGSEEAHLAVLASVRRSNWTCRFPASSFHRGERLLGCKEGMRWINWTFLSPSGLIQSASLLGRTGSGFSLRELSSCLTLLICPSGSFLLPLSVAFPNFSLELPPAGGKPAFTGPARYYSTVRPLPALHSPFRLLAYRVAYATATAATRRVLLGS